MGFLLGIEVDLASESEIRFELLRKLHSSFKKSHNSIAGNMQLNS
jgi:hypothetical protein